MSTMCCSVRVQVSYSQLSTSARRLSSVKVVVSVTSARTWSKMGSSTESKTRSQNWGEKEEPWYFRMSNSISRALYLQCRGSRWRRSRGGGGTREGSRSMSKKVGSKKC